jgi:hypothetical protein
MIQGSVPTPLSQTLICIHDKLSGEDRSRISSSLDWNQLCCEQVVEK